MPFLEIFIKNWHMFSIIIHCYPCTNIQSKILKVFIVHCSLNCVQFSLLWCHYGLRQCFSVLYSPPSLFSKSLNDSTFICRMWKNHLQKVFVPAKIVRQLGMESCGEYIPLSQCNDNWLVVLAQLHSRQDFHRVISNLEDCWSADEYASKVFRVALGVKEKSGMRDE